MLALSVPIVLVAATVAASSFITRKDTSICPGAGFFDSDGPFHLFAFNTSLGVANTTGTPLVFAPRGTDWVLAVSPKLALSLKVCC